MRPATIDDAEILLRWRNDPATREASINMDAVPRESHMAWLAASLKNPKRALLIAETNTPIGMVRLDYSAESAELSWTVAPEARGQGYGTEMVRLALPKDARVVAQIKKGNTASQKIAKAVGLQLVDDGDLQRWEVTTSD